MAFLYLLEIANFIVLYRLRVLYLHYISNKLSFTLALQKNLNV
jgi:hypothetical protein